jgi:DNA-binding transcriptional regulator YhcF (GntR family)
MDPNWNDNQPIYRQLRDRMVALILEGALKEGDPLPSVRAVAADYRLNPLTVLKGYQQLVDERLVEKRRGRGMYVSEGARGYCWPASANGSCTRSGRKFWRSSIDSDSRLRNCLRRRRRLLTRHRRPAAAMPKKNESPTMPALIEAR